MRIHVASVLLSGDEGDAGKCRIARPFIYQCLFVGFFFWASSLAVYGRLYL